MGVIWFLVFNIPYNGKPIFSHLQTAAGWPLKMKKSWDALNHTQDTVDKAFSGIKKLKDKYAQKINEQ